MSNIDKYKNDLDSMLQLGQKMERDLLFRCRKDLGTLEEGDEDIVRVVEGCFERDYHRWYTEACVVIKQLIPDRYSEFESFYKGDGRKKDLKDLNELTYTIQDWLTGIRFVTNSHNKRHLSDLGCLTMRFVNQLDILTSVQSRFESTLFDIKQLVQADLFDSELDVARELLRHKFFRAAGAIAGVILEKHLAQVVANHSITTDKRNLTINNLNKLLKDEEVLDVPSWHHIKSLAAIRNSCVHDGQPEPTYKNIEDLINGVEKYTRELS